MIFEVQTHWRQNNFKLRLCTKPESQLPNHSEILQRVTVFWKESMKQRLQKQVKASLATFLSYNKSTNDFWDGWEMGGQVNHLWKKPRKTVKMNGTFAWVKAARLFLGTDFATHLLRIQWFQLQLQTDGQTYFSASFWCQCSTAANPKQTRNKNFTARRKKKLFPSSVYNWPLPSSELT